MLFIDKGYYAWKRIFEQIFSVNKDPSRQLTESTVHVWCDTLHTYWTMVLNCRTVTDVGVPHSGALVWRILGTREGAQHYRGALQYGIQSDAKSIKSIEVFYIEGKNSSNCIFYGLSKNKNPFCGPSFSYEVEFLFVIISLFLKYVHIYFERKIVKYSFILVCTMKTIINIHIHIRASNFVSEDFKLRIKLKNKFLPRPKSASPI